MAIKGIDNNASSLWSEIRRRWADFRKGEKSLSKEELEKMKIDTQSAGKNTAKLDLIINNYDKIDLNGDGVSVNELRTYKRNSRENEFNGKKFTKEDLIVLRDRIAQTTGTNLEGLTRIIDSFEQADADGDGALSAREMNSFAKSSGFSLYTNDPKAEETENKHHLSDVSSEAATTDFNPPLSTETEPTTDEKATDVTQRS